MLIDVIYLISGFTEIFFIHYPCNSLPKSENSSFHTAVILSSKTENAYIKIYGVFEAVVRNFERNLLKIHQNRRISSEGLT